MQLQGQDIEYFNNVSSRSNNDIANQKREDIMIQIIKWISLQLFEGISQHPSFLFENDDWKNLYREMDQYLFTNLPEGYNKENIVSLKPKQFGGRSHNYDFAIIYGANGRPDHVRNIEFKFNMTQVEDSPQFHSPFDPEPYIISDIPFTRFHYDNYLSIFESFIGMNKPSYEEYKKQMKFSNNPTDPFLRACQRKYYSGSDGSSQYTGLQEDIEFYEISKDISKESFRRYFEICELNHEALTNIWLEKQKNKEYMLFRDGKLNYQTIDEDSYKIVSVENRCPNFICKTMNDRTLKVLFRWKNGNGIAFPAFQVKLI